MMDLSRESSRRIQILRGIAIIAVVLIHNTPAGITQVWCRPLINFGVGTFLFLSGMLSRADRWHPQKRIRKVIIPYAVWTLIYVVISHYETPVQIPLLFLKYLVTGRAAAVMYYVFVYCELTLLIPLIDKLARSKYRLLGFLISPLEIILMRLIPVLGGYAFNRYVAMIMHVSCVGWFGYFYLGYLLGNGLASVRIPTRRLVLFLAGAVGLQVLEGYLYYSVGEVADCGSQLKLTSVLTGMIFVLIAYRYITAEAPLKEIRFLLLLGNHSFGIFFSHLAVMAALRQIPRYTAFAVYPLNGVIALLLSLGCVLIGHRLLGRAGKYLAL